MDKSWTKQQEASSNSVSYLNGHDLFGNFFTSYYIMYLEKNPINQYLAMSKKVAKSGKKMAKITHCVRFLLKIQ